MAPGNGSICTVGGTFSPFYCAPGFMLLSSANTCSATCPTPGRDIDDAKVCLEGTTKCDPTCIECSGSLSTQCTQCSKGYYLSASNTCLDCDSTCATCSGPLEFDCTGCGTMMILNTGTGVCEPCNDGCAYGCN